MAWRWNARRLIVSAFVIFHLSAICLWTMPPALSRITPGLLPVLRVADRHVAMVGDLRARTRSRHDHAGRRDHRRQGDAAHLRVPSARRFPWWQKVPRYRQPKFTGNMGSPEYLVIGKFTARYAARQLGLEPEAFPLWVSLYYQVKDTPPPGATAASDPMAPADPDARAIRVCLDR